MGKTVYWHVQEFDIWGTSRKEGRQWQPTPILLPGKSHGQRSLVGCSPWGRGESDKTERIHFHFSLSFTGEGNGNPLQCSCLEHPRNGGAWWAAIYGVAQSRTWLKRLSSSSSSNLQSEQYLLLLSHFDHIQLRATLWTVACQPPLSTGFSRQEYWIGSLWLPGYFPNPGIKPRSLALQADSLPLSRQGSPNNVWYNPHFTEDHKLLKVSQLNGRGCRIELKEPDSRA